MIKRVLISTAVAGAVFAAAGLDNKLRLTQYVIKSDKVSKQINLAFLSDIHSMRYKDGGKKLFKIIDCAKPDCVILGGDIFDKYSNDSMINSTYELVRNLVLKYGECYFVTGNHEFESGKVNEIKSCLESLDVKVLGEKSYISSQNILIGGTDYVALGEDEVLLQKQGLIELSKEKGLFTVLARHVPMHTDGDENFDLILSGHNHGGLWRLPNTPFGVAGGGGKFFPRFVHGKYTSDGTAMIVGSGITTVTKILPRLYNPPEVVSVSIIPE